MKILFLISILIVFMQAKTNSLIESESPYLLAHAHNPVDWNLYSDKVFNRAKEENKLIFLSIGYSTCHWCHVMERESFENEKIASLLNKDYISIKVDKEEMPQIDTHYQYMHSLLKKGRNGWPLSIILTPQKEIIHIATYIPPTDNYGIEGMERLLPRIAKLFSDNPKKAEKLLKENHRLIVKNSQSKKVTLSGSLSESYLNVMKKRHDRIYEGFDKRPKFPLASHLNLLLDIYFLENNKQAFELVKNSLDAMMNGGIYDQIDGGFFRYSVDPDWIIPHFEKMLYTQAELIPLYTKLYLLSGDIRYKKVVQETIIEVYRRFEKDGLFFSASDADSDSKEGEYFVYEYDHVDSQFKKRGFSTKEREDILEYFDITEIGNFEEGKSNVILSQAFEHAPSRAEEAKMVLKSMRDSRTFPFVDKKVITSWNSMMITALFEASKIDKGYEIIASVALESLLEKMYQKGVLYHKFLSPHNPNQIALLEDYSFLIDALLSAYHYTHSKKHLLLAQKLTFEAVNKFYRDSKWHLDDGEFNILSHYKDKYYTTPLAKLFHNMLSIANLTYDLKFLEEVKNYIKDEKDKILTQIDSSPEATRALIRVEYGDVVLKSTKQNLSTYQDKINRVKYPFLLTSIEESNLYMLCDEKSCFFADKNITKVLKKIDKP